MQEKAFAFISLIKKKKSVRREKNMYFLVIFQETCSFRGWNVACKSSFPKRRCLFISRVREDFPRLRLFRVCKPVERDALVGMQRESGWARAFVTVPRCFGSGDTWDRVRWREVRELGDSPLRLFSGVHFRDPVNARSITLSGSPRHRCVSEGCWECSGRKKSMQLLSSFMGRHTKRGASLKKGMSRSSRMSAPAPVPRDVNQR